MTHLLRRVPAWGVLCFSLALCGAGADRTNRALEKRGEPGIAEGDVGPLPDGETLRVLSLGFDRVLADLFWLRTVYYVGDEHAHAAGYPAVRRLAELVTDIDPSFRTAYVTMAGAISGLSGDPDGAIALLEKGIANGHEYWKLHFMLGFSYFIEKQDYGRAAEEIRRASELPGSPPYLPLLAARLYANAGDRDLALGFIRARLAEERAPSNRAALEKRYADLWISRDLERIDAAIERFRAERGEDPLVMEELLRSGHLESELRDPKGGAYRIEEGRATSELPYDRLEVHLPHGFGVRPGERGPAGEEGDP